MADEEVVVNLTYDARASAQRMVNDSNKVIENLDKILKKTSEVSDNAGKVNNTFSGLSRLMEKMANDIDPWSKGLRTAQREADVLASKIQALSAKRSRNEDEEALLTRSLAIIPQVTARIKELQAATSQAFNQPSAAANGVIENLKRYQNEAQKAANEALKFSQQMAKSSDIGAHTAATNKMIDNLKRYQAEQRKASEESFKFAGTIAPSSSVSGHRSDVANKLKEEKAAFDAVTAAGERLAASQAAATNKMIESLRKYQAQQKLANDEAFKFQKQMAPGAMSIEAHRKSVDNLNKSLENGKTKHREFADGMKHVEANSRQMQFAVTNLSFQVNDVVSGLAMGQQPMRIFAQQAGQFIQLFQQGGGFSTVMRGAGAAIVSFITPMTAFITVALGVAAVIGVITARAFSNIAMMKEFSQSISGVETVSAATSKDLLKLSFDMRAVGVSAEDANKAIMAFGRNANVNLRNPKAIEELTKLGMDIGARLGVGDAEGMNLLNQALNQGADAMFELAMRARALTSDEAKLAVEQINLGNRVRTMNAMLPQMQNNLEGVREGMRSGWTQLFDTIGEQWNTMLNNMTKNPLFKELDDKLKIIAANMKEANEQPAAFSAEGRAGISSWFSGWMPTFGDMQSRANRLNTPSVLDAANTPVGSPFVGRFGPSLEVGGALTGGLVSDLQVPLRNMIQAAANDGIVLGVGSGLRTTQHQAELFSAAIAKYGSAEAARRHVAPPGSSQHELGRAADLVGASGRSIERGSAEDLWLRSNAGSFGVVRPMGHEPWHVERAGGRSLSSLPSSIASVAGAGLQMDPDLRRSEIDLTDRSTESLIKLQGEMKREAELAKERVRISKLYNIDQQAETAGLAAKTAALAQGKSTADAATIGERAANETREIAIAQLEKEANITGVQTRETLKASEAHLRGAAAGERAEAAGQALVESMRTGADQTAKYNEILAAGAASAFLNASKQEAAGAITLENEHKVAEAAKVSNKARHDAEIQVKAQAQTQEVLNKAEATGNTLLIEAAKRLTEKAAAQLRAREIERQSLETTDFVNQQLDTRTQLRFQIQNVGMTPEVLQGNLNVLKEMQETERTRQGLSEKQVQARLDEVKATQNLNIALAEALRQQQRIEDMFRSIANTIDQSLTKAIEDAFDGKKTESWGVQIKKMLSGLVAQMSSSLFIKPLLGSVAGLLGMGNVANQLGSFGNLFGGSTSGAGSVSLTPDGKGGFTVGNISDVASIGKSVGLFDNIFGTGSGSGFFSNIGSSLGFGETVQHFGGGGGIAEGVGAFDTVIPGSLFGTTTLGSALGGIGAGFGAGTLINSLVGGNTMGGTIGSGMGSLAGALIGSIIPGIGTMIGGLIGGAGGGLLGGMFGSSKPSNASAGGSINLATGKIEGTFKGGNSEIDQAALSAVQSISSFTQSILKSSGGTLSGSALIQHGVNTGFTVDSSLPEFSGRYNLGKDANEVVRVVELALARSLQGVSDTVKHVINSIDDPALLEAGIAFAAVYDNMKKAVDEAFSGVPGEIDKIGPFAQALENIGVLFDDLTDKANQYNLSVAPIDAVRLEALKRLTADFDRTISDAILGIKDPTAQLLEIEKRAGEERVREAEAVAGDMAKVQELNALKIEEIMKSTSTVIEQTAEDIKNQFKSIEEFRQEVQFGQLSGKKVEAAVAGTMEQFNRVFGEVMAGDLTRLNDLVSLGTQAINFSVEGYGNAPQTNDLRQVILSDINTVLAGRGFARGTTNTPPGWIKVHQDEWMYQGGGNVVVPKGQSAMPGVDELTQEVMILRKEMGELLAGGNHLAAAIGSEIVKRQDKQTKTLVEIKPVYTPVRNAV